MQEEIRQEVLSAFAYSETGTTDPCTAGQFIIEPVSGGLINHTYKITCRQKPSYILQRINKNVFHNPVFVQENYITVWKHAEFEFTGLRLPAPRYCGKMTTLFVDDTENYWRAFEFIHNAITFPYAETEGQALSTARIFAQFTAALTGFNVRLLKNVIPGFHDLDLRFWQLEDAMKGENYERLAKAFPLVNALKQRERYRHFYEIITESGKEFPLRVMHHDAKIANVLFSKYNGGVICPVDFDTLMPGYYYSDIGDMIRSMAPSRDENSTDFDNLFIRKGFYEALLGGYLSVMGNHLTRSEKKYLHYAGILMVYMQALRFLTDYINGDVYYQTTYEEQNFDRAQNQFTVLQRLEQFLEKEYAFRV